MSNLSKIKPKLRTEGRVSGNFGRSKVRAGSSLNDVGFSSKETISVPVTQDAYLERLYAALEKSPPPPTKRFILEQIRSIHIQRGTWGD